MLRWKRTVRTGSSERFEAVRDGLASSVAVADLHYIRGGAVIATIVLLREAGWNEEQVPDLLASLDEDLLPSVDAADGNLSYTVFIGELISTSSRA